MLFEMAIRRYILVPLFSYSLATVEIRQRNPKQTIYLQKIQSTAHNLKNPGIPHAFG